MIYIPYKKLTWFVVFVSFSLLSGTYDLNKHLFKFVVLILGVSRVF